MKYTTLVVAAALASVQSVRGLMVNTPTSLVQCQPILFTWQDGTPPYYFSLIPGGQPSAPALQTWPPTDATSFTWTVNIPAGTSITPTVKDSTGAIAYADAVTVQSSSQTNCTGSGSPPPVGSGEPSAAPVATAGATGTAPSGSSPASVGNSPSASASSSARPTGSQAAVASARPSSAAVASFSIETAVGGLASFIAIVGALVF